MLIKKITDSFELTFPMLSGLFICGLSILFIIHHKLILHDSKDYFGRPMTKIERQEMIELLEKFTQKLSSNKIDYFIHFGTLIGSIRHHGMVPWDDDIDIYIDRRQKAKLARILEALYPTYILYNRSDILSQFGQWKFYKMNSSRSFVHRSFKWPYIDIWFYTQNETHVYHEMIPEEGLLKTDVYPLVKRPFENLWISAPCNSSNILKGFAIEKCISRSYSHLLEFPLYNWWQRVILCKKLFSKHPFVYHKTNEGYQPYYVLRREQTGNIIEILKIGSEVVGNVTVFKPHCSGKRKPY